MANVKQDKEFISAMISQSLLEEAVEWISDNMSPEDVFSEKQLEAWAARAGYELSEEQQTQNWRQEMIEVRWVSGLDYRLQLQSRTSEMQADDSGAVCGPSEWSDWQAVPIVHSEEQLLDTVDVFPSKRNGWAG